MKLTQKQRDLINKKTIVDSGIIYPTSWHSIDNRTVVTNTNINRQTGFYAMRIYVLTDDDKQIIVTGDDNSKLIDKYSEIILNRYE